MLKKKVKISVRSLVEAVYSSGDIDYRYEGRERLVEGTLGHQKLQRRFKKEAAAAGCEYAAEIPISYSLEYGGFIFEIEGRIDGIELSDGKTTIDEIKTTTMPLERIENPVNQHWAQAQCYAFFYAASQGIEQLDIRLIYFNINSGDLAVQRKTFERCDLESFFNDLIEKYYYWVRMEYDWCQKRNASLKALQFPFAGYRKGQRQMAVAVYKTITGGKRLFIQAATGIGKTMSVLFPSMKALGEEHTSKLFYLTAKTIARQAAEAAVTMLVEDGLEFRAISLTAKNKICFNDKAGCSPEECEYAKGHYDRVNEAVLDTIRECRVITRETVEKFARKHRVCPYELSLDLALTADCIICDYNYVFDPRVYLKRFFSDKGGDYVFLIDEAHNLADRARAMYSAEIWKKPFLQLKRLAKIKNAPFAEIAGKINSYMLELKKRCGTEGHFVLEQEPEELCRLLTELVKVMDAFLPRLEKSDGKDEITDIYFEVLAFLRITELYNEKYIIYAEKAAGDVFLKYFCLDPSELLGNILKKSKAAVFFSATLTPLEYYRTILGGQREDYGMKLSSPFAKEQLCVLLGSVSTRHKCREDSYWDIVEYIEALTDSKMGNFIVFFPSYKYTNEVSSRFEERHPDMKIIVQQQFMNEEDKEEYLEEFKLIPASTTLGFAVLGGIFSEGIDLKGERLSGVVIVGVGLPQLCFERDIISSYYQKINGLGYEYAYMYPGMNKVLQAAGRVIRSEQDRGVILLLDDRFKRYEYLRLFPEEWSSYRQVENTAVRTILERHWKNAKGFD